MRGLRLELGLVRHKPPLAREERDQKKKQSPQQKTNTQKQKHRCEGNSHITFDLKKSERNENYLYIHFFALKSIDVKQTEFDFLFSN